MTAIFNIISSIWNFMATIYKFIMLPVTLATELGRIIGSVVATWTTQITGLPSWLIGFATACIAINILFLLLGREAGK